MSLLAFFTWIVLRVETDIIGLDRYLCSRVYLHDPPGDEDNLHQHKDAPQELKEEEIRLATLDPEVNQWVAIPVLVAALALMAVTAEFVRLYCQQRICSYIFFFCSWSIQLTVWAHYMIDMRSTSSPSLHHFILSSSNNPPLSLYGSV
jgi:hypothetical protein